ncbi:MAG: hypothetical protein EAZ85_13645 [Bacteroidetes bacterium]|nr:MAG: hypothetical protein EAZ85_13645 [Bacteroidota bacterium]TAG85947.1 MAG: hypothetical protein EAZ20_13810 [Bacteroidota bacterium]
MEVFEKELYTQIEEELSLRLEQLQKINPSEAESIFIKYEFKKDELDFLFIHSIPAIYALWEGYVKKILGYYLEYLNKLKIPIQKVQQNILIFCAEYSSLKIQNYPKKNKDKLNYFEKFKIFVGNEIVNLPTIIDTKDNLGFSVINNLLSTFGLKEFEEYEIINEISEDIRERFFETLPQESKKYPLLKELGGKIEEKDGEEKTKNIKTSLLDMRNDISHQGIYGVEINKFYLKRFVFLVTFLMESVFEKIKIGVENKTYLKK